MNERIRELAEQAVKVVDNPFPGNPLNDELEKMYIPDCFAEKFAELIVQECADICDRMYFARYPDAEDFERSEEGDAIKQHFGIEQ